MMELANVIEAILFYQAEPLTIKRLSGLLKRSEEDLHEAIDILEKRYSETGLRLLTLGDEVAIGTAPAASALIEEITKEELSKDLSKASLETIAIVLYKGPITRAEIDYIRGVNSTFILRNLLIRGLVEKIDNPKDQRSFLYKPTFQLLQYMGVANMSELPDYDETVRALENFVAVKESSEEEKEASTPATEETRSEAEVGPEIGIIPGTEEETEEDEDDMFFDSELEIEADIAEADEAGVNFVDKAIEEHLSEDESRI